MRGPVVNFGDERLPERFWNKVQPCPMSGCWLWTGHVSNGYGRLQFGGRLAHAHRLSFSALVGDIPPGLHIDHRCRVRCCANPAHLESVTNAENTRRGHAGLATGARHRAKTHCRGGHPFQGDNLGIAKSGERYCQICREASRVRYRLRMKEAS